MCINWNLTRNYSFMAEMEGKVTSQTEDGDGGKDVFHEYPPGV